MKIAIVHDYLNQLGGAERVVGPLHRMFPEAPIYTTIVDRDQLWPSLADADIRPTWMQRLPGLKRHFKRYLPLYPLAIERMDLRAYDLVISSSSAFAKAAITRRDAFHLCYCHTPLRCVWDYDRYVARENLGRLSRAALPPVIDRLRAWDLATAARPDLYVANSRAVADRIRRWYGRESVVLPPPVEVQRHRPGGRAADDYLIVSRLVPYKRIDLAVTAFTAAGLPLTVIGDGPDRPALEALAGPTVRFLGRLPDRAVAEHFARARALIFPGEEDFGITPLEANAAGRPVVAYRAGGALDTVVQDVTGCFFDSQTPEALLAAVRRSQALPWNPDTLRRHAESFSEAAFSERFFELLQRLVGEPLPRAA